MKKKNNIKHNIFSALNVTVLVMFCLVCIYPFINSLAVALNESFDTMKGGITFFPRKFTFDNFKFILSQDTIRTAFVVTILRVVVATVISIVCLFAAAYALTKKTLPGRNFLLTFLMIPMFLTPGIIPQYILYGQLGLLNNFWVYILPGIFSFFNIVIIKAGINTIPDSLFESANIDGASEFRVLFSIVLPLSLPVLATIVLWTVVGNWSDWTTTLYYASSDKSLYTLQYYVQMFISRAQVIQDMIQSGQLRGASYANPKSLQAAQVMITTIPIVCAYPFLQKYFIKGIITGSVKE